MKKFLITGIIASSLFAMQWVAAETICDAKIALADARLNLMMMVVSTEKAEHDYLKTEIDQASTDLEKVLEAMLKDERKYDDAQLTTFQETWAKFKNTRETEIVPAIQVGNNDKALEIAIGVQAERMEIMNNVVQALNGDNCRLDDF
ncbi:MCP four helix bundle domain-containing protein [Candidatus Parabeggiatoa sp. HSG14]|uniref:MCP four helix bundle domain-containing protein n=1 Tax=Candidatus Parabeggiatoa sp. HSG14 TaxID=3055593 RepID=UPI0025A7C5B6|nr:MCP four helix bundle domain-containing protein [Thiotrichales bacterium HSG14]